MIRFTSRIFALSLIFVAGVTSWAHANQPFRHFVTLENRSEDGTIIDHPSLNGRPDLQVFATQRFGSYNPHEIGVAYDAALGRWMVQNDDNSPLEPGQQFHVIGFQPGSPQIFAHVTTAENTKEYFTYIRHPGSDFNATAHLLVTPHNTVGKRSAGPLGVWFDGKQWSIYRQDKKPMELGIRFNILVSSTVKKTPGELTPLGLSQVYLHTATPANTRGYLTRTELLDPDVFPFVTHNYREAGPYNFHVIGVWHNGTEWVILNQDIADIPLSNTFNVFVFSSATSELGDGDSSAPFVNSLPSLMPALGWIEFTNVESSPASFRLSYALDGQTLTFNTGPLAPSEGRRYEIPTRATRLIVRAQLEGDSPILLHESTFDRVPNREIDTRFQSTPPAAR